MRFRQISAGLEAFGVNLYQKTSARAAFPNGGLNGDESHGRIRKQSP